jgi:NAD(P)-dependent dehydrogenase (short-subunit alcohol dehydrogenase family)
VLTGRIALVTGSTRRLGATIARTLAENGAQVAIHSRSGPFQADVRDPAACQRLVQEVVSRFGALHILINNVGDYHQANVLDDSPEGWRAALDSNLNSTFYMCHHALPELMRHDYARIVNIGFTGAGPAVNNTAYTVAKHGVSILSKALAAAVKEKPLTVNVVSPGILEDAVAAPPLGRVPKGRWGREEEVAAAVLYFLGPDAGYVTGQELQVAGGWGL